MIGAEAYAQPFEGQCALATIAWEEAATRGISVEELVTDTSFISSYRYGGSWHREMYANPPEGFKLIADYAMHQDCTDYGARHFDGMYQGVCPDHPVWDKRGVIWLVKVIGQTCLYS